MYIITVYTDTVYCCNYTEIWPWAPSNTTYIAPGRRRLSYLVTQCTMDVKLILDAKLFIIVYIMATQCRGIRMHTHTKLINFIHC